MPLLLQSRVKPELVFEISVQTRENLQIWNDAIATETFKQ